MNVIARLLGCAALVACVASPLAAQEPDGGALYREHCKECHGAAGRPPKTAREKYKDVKALDAEFLAARSDDSLLVVLKRGVKDGKEMKSFKEKMTPEEMTAVVHYVRTRFGGGGATSP
ncbi:MAG TPA: c-type cytochrome [Gemmatimonadales bacterium]|nr:c-type cytochrome [Gemmatimonadales bacterium]